MNKNELEYIYIYYIFLVVRSFHNYKRTSLIFIKLLQIILTEPKYIIMY
jgi:hypothetical protein